MSDVTRLLNAVQDGDTKAADELLPLVYIELRWEAARRMSMEKPGQTLQATALVHEAWLRLAKAKDRGFQNRAHFFRAAAEAMRRILVEKARRKRLVKHGGDQQRVDLDEVDIPLPLPDDTLLALDEALDRYAVEDPIGAELIKLHFYCRLTMEEAAGVLGMSVKMAKRIRDAAVARLYREIQDGQNRPE